MGQLIVREAIESDPECLAEIIRLSPEAGNWSEAELRESIANPARRCLVAEADGIVAAFLVASVPAAGEAEILTLAVAPGARRRGIARALLQAFLRSVFGRVHLEVRRSNTAARQLYQSLGFMPAGLRPGYYESPREDAIVMQVTLDQPFASQSATIA